MSNSALIYSHVYYPPIAAEVVCGISREQGWRLGTIVKSAPSQLEIETQLVVDLLLRECFTRKSPRGTGRIDTPDTRPRPPGGFGAGPKARSLGLPFDGIRPLRRKG